jgi:hypothetical protein
MGFEDVCFYHGFSPMARLGVEATSAGSRFGLIHGRKVAVRHSGSCPHDGAFRQGSITEWSSELSALIEPLDLRPPVRVASTHGFHRGHWINHFDLPSAGCCMTSYRHRGKLRSWVHLRRE